MCYVCSSPESRDAAENEAGVGEAMAQGSAAPKRRLAGDGKAARRKRVFARLREGWAYDEIAREERVPAWRVREIISEVLRRREVDDGPARALRRLGPTLRAAGEAVADGDVRVIAALMKVLDRLERRLERDKAPPRAGARKSNSPQTAGALGQDTAHLDTVAATP
jgi:hypothetical protein